MRPLAPSVPNQVHAQRCNTPTPQQGILQDPRFGNSPSVQSPCPSCSHHNPLASNNFSQIPVQQHSLNHQFVNPTMMLDNRNTHFNNLQGNTFSILHRAPSTPSPFLTFANNWPMIDPAQHNHLGMQILGSPVPSHPVLQNGIFQPSNHPLAQFSYQNNQPQLHNQTMLPQPLGQFCSHNQLQILNQIVPMHPHGQICSHNQPQILHPTMHPPCSQHSVGPTPVIPVKHPPCSHSQNIAPAAHVFNPTAMGYCPNQILHPHEFQNHSAVENSHLGHNVAISNAHEQFNVQDPHTFVQPNIGHHAIQGLTTAVQSPQGNTFFPHDHGPMQVHQMQRSSQLGGFNQSQEKCVDDGAKHNLSNINQINSTGNNFTRNLLGPWKNDSPCARFQKPPLHHIGKGNFKPDKKNWKKSHASGQHKEGGRRSNLGNPCGQAGPDCKRSSVLSYTEKEIQQWREARKKHFPTKATIEKKLTDRYRSGESVDVDSKIRRQELKEILAKQAELGVEVAELPPNYLSESENVAGGKLEKRGGKFKRKFMKRGKQGQVNRHVKAQKFEDKDSPVSVLSERRPTLLQKLLSADIKRDKSHLLQVFRFMVMNIFFKEFPEKPLKFPVITVRGTASESEPVDDVVRNVAESNCSTTKAAEDQVEEEVGFEFGDGSLMKKQVQESEKEEGEIID